jgi:hypothetical protein
MNEFCDGKALTIVPSIIPVPPLNTLEDVKALAEGTSLVTDKIREGIVLRAKDDSSISFKFVSPTYLLLHKL